MWWSKKVFIQSNKPRDGLLAGNCYGLMEWAGAFGDLGTLIPFVLAYITLLKMNPVGILFSFGIAKICAGLFYKTPVPIQPMKAIGAASIATAGAFSPAAVWGAGIFTGLAWLVLGVTGIISKVAALAKKPVVEGIMLGLGFSFISQGLHSMRSNLLLAALAVFITLALIGKKKVPVMFILLGLGIVASFYMHPTLFTQLRGSFGFHLPHFTLGLIKWTDVVKGSLFLALPQIPLTLGNGIVAIVAENNNLFPQRPITEKKVAISTGVMNLISPLWGGVPMCHGAGGMAGHVRFGARSGGALVILGSLLIILALFFGNGIKTIFDLFPPAILGALLFFTGLELALTAQPQSKNKEEFYVTLVTAAFSLWNIGAAFLVGLLLNIYFEKKQVSI